MICKYFLLLTQLPFHLVMASLAADMSSFAVVPTCLLLLLRLASGSKNHRPD